MLTFSTRNQPHVTSIADPVSSSSSLSSSAPRRPYGNGCDIIDAMEPQTPGFELDESCVQEVDTSEIDCSGGETRMSDVDVFNHEQRQPASGFSECSLPSMKDAAASRSRSFTIDAILGEQHPHPTSTGDDDSSDASWQDMEDIDVSVVINQNTSSASPMDCSRLKAVRQSESNSCNERTSRSELPSGISASVSREEQLNLLDTSTPDGVRSADQCETNWRDSVSIVHRYPQVTSQPSPTLTAFPVLSSAIHSDVITLPTPSDVRPVPTDPRTASQSPWRRQMQHQQQQGVHHGIVHHHRGKRIRTIFTADQLHRLEAQFERQQYMVGTERYYLASSLRLTEAQVKVWFQNRRIKWRKQSIERQQAKMAVVSYNRLIDAEDDGFDDGDESSCPDCNDVTDSDKHSDASVVPHHWCEPTDFIQSTNQVPEPAWRLDTATGRRLYTRHSFEL